MVDVDLRRVGRVVGVVAFLLVLAVVVTAAVPALVGADRTYVVRSDSMSPAIGAGSLIYVADVPAGEISTGDVVTYVDTSSEGERRRVTHRVVGVNETDGERQFTTKGDANEEPDPDPVSPGAVLGVVQFHLPLVGYPLTWVQGPTGIVLLVVVPAALLAASELWALYREGSGGEGE